VLKDHERAGVFSLLVRQLELVQLRSEAERLTNEARERQAEVNALATNIRAGLNAFGIDLSGERPWDKVRDALGGELYNQAFEVVKGDKRRALLQIVDVEAPSERGVDHRLLSRAPMATVLIGQNGGGDVQSTELVDGSLSPNIRELVVARLQQAGKAGIKAAEIREFLGAQGVELHEKTVGMTLYRLSKEGRARREGRTWYSAVADDGEGSGATRDERETADSQVEP
jgi:hypothetical protein